MSVYQLPSAVLSDEQLRDNTNITAEPEIDQSTLVISQRPVTYSPKLLYTFTSRAYFTSPNNRRIPERFLDSFRPYYRRTDIASAVVDDRSKVLIGRRSVESVIEYIRYDDTDPIIERDAIQNNTSFAVVKYGTEEEQRLLDLNSHVEPVYQIIIPERNFTEANSYYQESTKNNGISYDSLSSLGSISQEDITVSATAGSITGLITEATEVIADAGGVTSRSRSIETTGVSEEVAKRTSDGTTTTATVTTSGY